MLLSFHEIFKVSAVEKKFNLYVCLDKFSKKLTALLAVNQANDFVKIQRS